MKIWVYKLWDKKYIRVIFYVLLTLIEIAIVYKGGKDLGKDFLYEWIYRQENKNKMDNKLCLLNESELETVEGGVGLIAFAIAVGCCAVVGGAFGMGAHKGMQEAIDSHK